MTKVKKITVSNLKAVSALSIDFNGCTAIITGGNNKGKSSFLRSLPDRIRGEKPELILKQGESEGMAELELTTGEKFLWNFDGKKEKLTYVSEKSIPTAVTKSISTAYFPESFDVDEFLNSSPAKQKKILQDITGIDFTEFDKMYKDAYEQRTYLNRVAAESKARLVFYDPKMDTELLPTEELEVEINGLEAHNLRFDSVFGKMLDKQNRLSSIGFELSSLKEKIAQLKKEKEGIDSDIIKGNEWMNDQKNKRKENLEELIDQLSDVRTKNAAISDNNKAKELQEAYDKALLNAQEQDTEVKRIEAEKLEVIKNSTLPEGFGFTDDGITYNGFSFDKSSLSSSGIYIGALKLAATKLGHVKTLHFDASYLDKNSLAEIEQWAKKEGLQLLIERPDFEGGEIEYQLISES